jgi:hypothetical protein
MYTMVFIKQSDHLGVLRFSLVKRSLMIGIALFFWVIAFSSYPTILWVAVVLGAICSLGGAYEETWKFYLDEKITIESSLGFWPLAKKKTYAFSELDAVVVYTQRTQLQTHMAGQARSWGYYRLGNKFEKTISRLELVDKKGEKVLLYVDSSKRMFDIISLADTLADFLKVQRVLREG